MAKKTEGSFRSIRRESAGSDTGFTNFSRRIYQQEFEIAKQKVDKFSYNQGCSDAEYCLSAADVINPAYAEMRPAIARAIHERIRNTGMFPEWDEFSDCGFVTTGNNAIQFEFHYFNTDFGSQFEMKNAECHAIAPIRYNNYYDNSNIEYFDSDFEKLDRPLKELRENKKKLEADVEAEEKNLASHSVGSCVAGTAVGVLKILLQLACSCAIGGAVAAIMSLYVNVMAALISVGAVIAVICMVAFWIKFSDDMYFMDFGMRKDSIRKLDDLKRKLASTNANLFDAEKITGTDKYIQAQRFDQELRDADYEFSEKWHRMWFDYIRKDMY